MSYTIGISVLTLDVQCVDTGSLCYPKMSFKIHAYIYIYNSNPIFSQYANETLFTLLNYCIRGMFRVHIKAVFLHTGHDHRPLEGLGCMDCIRAHIVS